MNETASSTSAHYRGRDSVVPAVCSLVDVPRCCKMQRAPALAASMVWARFEAV